MEQVVIFSLVRDYLNKRKLRFDIGPNQCLEQRHDNLHLQMEETLQFGKHLSGNDPNVWQSACISKSDP
jgi:hypothetical protein